MPLKDARSVTRDQASNSLLVLSRTSLQLWSFKGSASAKGMNAFDSLDNFTDNTCATSSNSEF
jgi:hypothetical protein